jgi:hypothetical protein
MSQHIYGAIPKNIYPLHLHDALRERLPYSNLASWQVRRYEPEFEILGRDYIGIEEETMTDETKQYLRDLGFVLFDTAGGFNEWLIKEQPEGFAWPI